MPRAMIVTVGAQASQIVFSVQQEKPEYLVLLSTDTIECRKSVEEIYEAYPLSPLKCRAHSTSDSPEEIGNVVKNLHNAYNWLTEKEKVAPKDIVVDPTGGRKWMSSGAIMIASFLGIEMIYVDAPFKGGRPDPTSMRIVTIGNAFEQVGFLEEHKADRLFNEENYAAACEIYTDLFARVKKPRKVEVKKLICEGMTLWQQFRFRESCELFETVQKKMKDHSIMNELNDTVLKYLYLLRVLQVSDRNQHNFFENIKDRNFTHCAILNLLLQAEKYSRLRHYDFAVLLNYRILEFISQYRLSTHNIDSDKVPDDIREKFRDKFKEITKTIYGAESEIPDKVALLNGVMLLYCIEDPTITSLAGGKHKFLSKLREETEVRNKLWAEHGNLTVNQHDFRKFKGYIESWIVAHDKSILKEFNEFPGIRF